MVFTPPPPYAPPQAAPVIIASTLPGPPDIGIDPSATEPPPISATMPPELEPPKPPPPPPRAAAPPKPAAPAPAPEQPAPPALVQIFTAQEAREYTRALNQSLDIVEKDLKILASKTLNAEQSDSVNRIRTFQKQAEQARDQDLVTAVSLARRAEVLAQDLIGRLP